MTSLSSAYRGRFAPSPTGPLHFGSLVAALASFLDARQQRGQWLVRIEDIDPLREVEGASDDILRTLEAHQLHWDESVRYQSDRSDAYEALIEQLRERGHCYYCPCSRKALLENNGKHNPDCNPAQPSPSIPMAIRFHATGARYSWQDLLLGPRFYQSKKQTDDFVIKRKEGFYAYQLAVVCDDIDQQISHIVRGSDLLDSTPPQLALYYAVDVTPPRFGHIPVILNQQGQKLSKQNLAKPIENEHASLNLYQALKALNQTPPEALKSATVDEILCWGVNNWSLDTVPKRQAIQAGWHNTSGL